MNGNTRQSIVGLANIHRSKIEIWVYNESKRDETGAANASSSLTVNASWSAKAMNNHTPSLGFCESAGIPHPLFTRIHVVNAAPVISQEVQA